MKQSKKMIVGVDNVNESPKGNSMPETSKRWGGRQNRWRKNAWLGGAKK